MEMLNRATETARDFEEFRRKLTQLPTLAEVNKLLPPKRPGENRQQYRERLHKEPAK